MSHNYYENKTIWITGASSGIGEGFAHALSAKGAKVILSSRNSDQLYKVKQELTLPENCFVVPIDMESDQAIDEATKTIIAEHKVDIAILNAGISQRSLALETDIEIEEKIMRTNYHGLVRAAKQIIRPMLVRNSGHLVVMSSVTGKIGVPERSSYSASKHALHGYFDSLRAEIEDQGVYISLICPGYIHTNISYNAVQGDGRAQKSIDLNSKNGMKVEKFVDKALKGIARGKREMLIGGKETYGVYLKRFAPSLLFKAVKNVKA